MQQGENIQPKAKRVRLNPTKKWTVAEEKALVEFLMGNRNFEKPTAQSYYRRFAEEANIAVEWKLILAKVRNMRLSYNKAKAWEGSTGAGSMEGETLKATLLKKCTCYYELDEVFGGRIVEAAIIEESLDSASSNDIFNSTIIEIEEGSTSATYGVVESAEPPSAEPPSRRGIYSRTAVSDIREIYSETLKLKREKIENESTLREREVYIKERELALKEKEIDLKVKELEMKERLAMEEFRLKYK
ncbi:uncharacterized protein LOC118740557 [Rhagoletis pomonella]|uniref:uncharacterized protein LOC118740557 n=1 Tax=Rhagoletis pomonella TaxID=28610 RepID=UPI00177DD5ED|nr:uncharacterized protein LOC118740557 [Rhagoletis pomonella]